MSVQRTSGSAFKPSDFSHAKTRSTLGESCDKIHDKVNEIISRDEFHKRVTIEDEFETVPESEVSISGCLPTLHPISHDTIVKKPDETTCSNLSELTGETSMFQKVTDMIGAGVTVVTNALQVGLEYAKPLVTKIVINTSLNQLQKTNTIDLDATRKQLTETSGSAATSSAIMALSAVGLMKKQLKYVGQESTVKSESVQAALTHPYIQDLYAHMLLQVTNALYQKFEKCEGQIFVQFGIDALKTINGAKNSEEIHKTREETINSLTTTLMELLYPKGVDSVDFGQGLETLSQYGVDLKWVLYNQLENSTIKPLATKIYDSLHDQQAQSMLMAQVVEKMHKSVGSKAVDSTGYTSTFKEAFKKARGALVFKETHLIPSQDSKQAMSSELTKLVLNQVKSSISPTLYKLLTVPYVGVLAPNGILMKILTNKVGEKLLSNLGSVDVKKTMTNMLKEITSKNIPEGKWAGDSFTYDADKMQRRLEENIEVPTDPKQPSKIFDERIKELTSEKAIQQFIEAVPVKLAKSLLTWGSSFQIAKLIAPYVQAIVGKLKPKVTEFFDRFIHGNVELFSRLNKRRILKKIGENIRMIPTIGVEHAHLVTKTIKQIS